MERAAGYCRILGSKFAAGSVRVNRRTGNGGGLGKRRSRCGMGVDRRSGNDSCGGDQCAGAGMGYSQ